MPEVTLIEDTHEYIVEGIHRPGVTTVIKAAGLMGYLPEDKYYLDRGTYIHDALQLYLNDNLDMDSLSEGIKGYVESGIKYIEHTRYKALHIEAMLYDPIYQYCGTPDGIPLLDWKSGGKEHWHKIQIAAYDNLIRVNKIESAGIPLNVHLRADGKMPKVEPYKAAELRDALKVFFSALILYNFRKERKLL